MEVLTERINSTAMMAFITTEKEKKKHWNKSMIAIRKQIIILKF